ncbi:hypothetical protein [Azospirillum argentinense]
MLPTPPHWLHASNSSDRSVRANGSGLPAAAAVMVTVALSASVSRPSMASSSMTSSFGTW